MAQAQGILPSAVCAVEGVPLPSIEVVRKAPAGASESSKHFADLGAPAPLRKGFVLQFRNKCFLNSYRDDGVWATATLEHAKIFSACPTSAADLLNAQILIVLANIDGSGVRRTLLRVPTCASTPGRESLALEIIRSKVESSHHQFAAAK
jgi:hypothetical protein